MSEKSPRLPPRFFATAAKGTEPLLRDELNELGLPRVRADRGGVHQLLVKTTSCGDFHGKLSRSDLVAGVFCHVTNPIWLL